jgi:hypothetical protein
MKRDGIEYDERMALLEEITYPKPLADLLTQSYEVFASSQPWVRDFELSPKSVVRDMFERAMSFAEYVSSSCSAGGSGAALPVGRLPCDPADGPAEARTDELVDIIEWLGELVRQVDSSSSTSGRRSSTAPRTSRGRRPGRAAGAAVDPHEPARSRCSCATSSSGVQLAASRTTTRWSPSTPTSIGPPLDAYYDEHDEILTGAAARSPRLCVIDEASAAAGRWRVEQTIDDPAGDHDWRIRAEVDLEASVAEGAAIVRVVEVVRL